MLGTVRRLSKSKIGTAIMALFLLLVVASFALGDLSNVTGGNFGGSGNSSTLATVGGAEITENDLSQAMETRLQQVRQQNPEADYSAVAADFEPLLQSMIDMHALEQFAEQHGFTLSKRLVDAEIANIPGTRGLDGRFSQEAYAQFLSQQRLTDAYVRRIIASSLLQRLLVTPVAANPRVPVGVATPYASMLLETREGAVATIPVAAFRAGLNPSDADLQRFYAQNRNRYMVPEQRVLRLARIGPEQVGNVSATDQEITAYYNANRERFAPSERRVISQAVVPDQAAANAIAARAKGGATIAAAAAPAGASAAVTTLDPQTRQSYAAIAGEAAAAAAFSAAQGAVIGPVQSDFGWIVAKVDTVQAQVGRSLAEARAEIAEAITSEKRKNALTDLVTQVEDALAEGANFNEAAAQAKLPVTQTPLITAAGVARGDPAYRFAPELASALKGGFELAPTDEPVVETLAEDQGFVMVSPAEVVPAAPAPLASIRERVANDWILAQAQQRARNAAAAIASKAARNLPLRTAVQQAGTPLPPVRELTMRRLQLTQLGNEVPPPVQMLFNLGEGKSRMVAAPDGSAFYVVKVDEITPGNALSQPNLINQVQRDFQNGVSEEYALQFLAAVRKAVDVERNEQAIAAARTRILGN